jgi:thiol:disulfide interchange protein
MSTRRSSILFVLLAAFCGSEAVRAVEPATAADSPYLVDKYDPGRDAADDVKSAAARAKQEHKHVLVQVGGDWCGWCHLMSKYFHENEAVAAALAKNYVIVKVNYSTDNKNEAFLGKLPKIRGYPHIFVFDGEGKLLHSQGTAELEEGKGYSEKVMLAFLEKWGARHGGKTK